MLSFHKTCAIALCLFLPLASIAGDLSVGGYCKSFFSAHNIPRVETPFDDPIDFSSYGIALIRLRLNADYRFSDRLLLSTAYDIIPRIHDDNQFPGYFMTSPLEYNSQSYRLDDIDQLLYPSSPDDPDNFKIFQNLDRLNLSVSLPLADIILGRQAVAWGSARVVNPTDVIAPYACQELDTENRIGVDAMRLRIPLGFMSEIDAGYIFGDKARFENSAVFLRNKFYLAKTDISASLVGFREHLMLGLDLARSVGGAGVWAEGAYVFNKAFSEYKRNNAYDYFRLSAGGDYSLTGRLYGFIEYHFNEAGKSGDYNLSRIMTHPAYTEGGTFLLGKHYITPGVSYQLTPLITVGGEALCNLNDPSVLLSFRGEYNIAQNVYLSLGAFIGLGQSPEPVPADPHSGLIAFHGEFGSYTDIMFSSFRFYF